MKYPSITLKKNEEKRIAAGHPWAYSNEINMDGAAKALAPGSVVEMLSAGGVSLGLAHFNPHSLIAARILTREKNWIIGKNFWKERLAEALEVRNALFARPYYRLVHAEADGLPGLIIDRFGDVLVMQPNTAGMDTVKEVLAGALIELIKPSAILLRGDNPARKHEGLEEETIALHGNPPARVDVEENGILYRADISTGQKTGWFYDQRANRAAVAAISRGRDVADLYAHTGGFGILAAKAGAKNVVCVDSSESSLALANETARRMNLTHLSCHRADVFDFCTSEQKRFGMVVADPPAFAKSKKDVGSALRGYRKLAKFCAQITDHNGFVFIASCSHAILRERFDEEVLRGVAEAGRRARILLRSSADADHPAHPYLPESTYLKGLLLHVV